MDGKIPKSFKVDPDLDKRMTEFAKIHYSGNVSKVVVNGISHFLDGETEKISQIPEDLINAILFSTSLLQNGRMDEKTWDLLLKEAWRECKILGLK